MAAAEGARRRLNAARGHGRFQAGEIDGVSTVRRGAFEDPAEPRPVSSREPVAASNETGGGMETGTAFTSGGSLESAAGARDRGLRVGIRSLLRRSFTATNGTGSLGDCAAGAFWWVQSMGSQGELGTGGVEATVRGWSRPLPGLGLEEDVRPGHVGSSDVESEFQQ